MGIQRMPVQGLCGAENIRYTVYYSDDASPLYSAVTKPHLHGWYEVYVNVTGEVSFLVNDRVYPVERGTVIFIRPNDVHMCLCRQGTSHEHFCLWMDLSRAPELMAHMDALHSGNHWLPDAQMRERLIEWCRVLVDPQTPDVRKTAVFFEVLALLRDGQESTEGPVTVLPPEMQRILNHINAHFSEIRYIKEVYDQFYISSATLNRWFRKHVGTSPREFLESKKLAYAKQLLERGRTVIEAAEQAGFSDCSYFISVFKRKFGMTPREYKRQLSR